MRVSVMFQVTSMDADSFVHFAKTISKRVASLHADSALPIASMAQAVLALQMLSQNG